MGEGIVVVPDLSNALLSACQLTLNSRLQSQRFLIRVAASNATTCILWISSRIALSFDVIGFLRREHATLQAEST